MRILKESLIKGKTGRQPIFALTKSSLPLILYRQESSFLLTPVEGKSMSNFNIMFPEKVSFRLNYKRKEV
jgi:hypothetical protein